MSNQQQEPMSYTQETFIMELCDGREQVNIFLTNGIRLHGVIGGYDDHTVLLEGVSPQIVYKHAISTIMVNRTA